MALFFRAAAEIHNCAVKGAYLLKCKICGEGLGCLGVRFIPSTPTYCTEWFLLSDSDTSLDSAICYMKVVKQEIRSWRNGFMIVHLYVSKSGNFSDQGIWSFAVLY